MRVKPPVSGAEEIVNGCHSYLAILFKNDNQYGVLSFHLIIRMVARDGFYQNAYRATKLVIRKKRVLVLKVFNNNLKIVIYTHYHTNNKIICNFLTRIIA